MPQRWVALAELPLPSPKVSHILGDYIGDNRDGWARMRIDVRDKALIAARPRGYGNVAAGYIGEGDAVELSDEHA